MKRPLPWLLEDEEQRRRFMREGRAASRINHPSVITILDTFEYEDVPWLVMAFIPGESLRGRLDHAGKLPPGEALRYAVELVSGLMAAHEKGVLHRDINPRNILMTRDDRALLTDFGLARILHPSDPTSTAPTASTSLTSTGAVMGTPHYMSPEQLFGHPIDARSDIFSLGAVLYEMCTGVLAFAKSQFGDAVDAIAHREPEPISKYTYDVPEEFERIIRKCLSKDPQDRYQNTGDLHTDLAALRRRVEFKSYSDSHRPAPAARRLPRSPWMRWLPAAAAALIAVPLVILNALKSEPPPFDNPRQVTTGAGWEGEPALSPDGNRIAFVSDDAGNLDIMVMDARGGRPLRITNSEAQEYNPAWFPDGSALAYVNDRDGAPSIWKIGPFGGDPTLLVPDGSRPAVSPDGTRIAFERSEPSGVRIWVADIAEPGREVRISSGLWYQRSAAWSRDGRTIVYASQEDLWTVPSSGGKPARRLTRDGGLHTDPVWMPDGRRVLFSSDRGGPQALWSIEVGSGRLRRLTVGSGPESHPSLSADGSRLAYSTQKSTYDLVIRNRDSGAESSISGLLYDWMPALSPDGGAVAFISDREGSDLEIWVQKLDSGRPVGDPRRLTDQPGAASHPAWSPDGRWIAYYRIIDGRRDLWIIPAGGGQPERLTEDPDAEIQPAWSPDGSRIAYASDAGGHWHVCVLPVSGGHRAGGSRVVTPDSLEAIGPEWLEHGLAFVGTRDGRNEAWIVDPEGHFPPRSLTVGAGAGSVVRDYPGDGLLVAGRWGGNEVTLRAVSPEGAVTLPGRPASFGGYDPYPFFDASRDGTLLAWSRERLRGDIWLMETVR